MRKDAVKARKQQTLAERLEANQGKEHEAGSFAADRQSTARQARLEQDGVFFVHDPSAALSTRPRRDSVKKMTEEQLLVASQRATRASAAGAKPAKAKPAKITNYFCKPQG